MNTQISTKLAALAVALMMNSLIMGGVAYVFNGQFHQHASLYPRSPRRRRPRSTALPERRCWSASALD
jgi:hypothetical protein